MEEIIMSKQYTEEFKKDAVRYWFEHQDIGIIACARNLGVSKSDLHGVNYTLIMMGQYLQEAGVIMKAMRQRKMPDYAESLEMHRMLWKY